MFRPIPPPSSRMDEPATGIPKERGTACGPTEATRRTRRIARRTPLSPWCRERVARSRLKATRGSRRWREPSRTTLKRVADRFAQGRAVSSEQLTPRIAAPVRASAAIMAASVPSVMPLPLNPVATNWCGAGQPMIGNPSAEMMTSPLHRLRTRASGKTPLRSRSSSAYRSSGSTCSSDRWSCPPKIRTSDD